MTFEEYLKKIEGFDLLGDGSTTNAGEPAYVAKILGLVGEAGEVAEKYKKVIRDKEGIIGKEDKDLIIKELGDVLWYTAMLAKYLGVSFEDIAIANINKLSSRKERGVQRGSGDNR
jgi:NTP pyrophosphatase (non-canonical NTP hydrolase)